MKNKWIATSLAVLMTGALAVSGSAEAAPANGKKGNDRTTAPSIVERYEAAGNPNASVTVQPEAMGAACVNDPITNPDYYTVSCYANTTYDVVSSRLLQYDATPLTNQTFLISVAKGQTKTLSTSTTQTSTVTTKWEVSIPILKVINLTLTNTETGTVTKTYSTTTLYTGPAESSPYNTRSYWSAVTNDLHELTVQENNHYMMYVYATNGSDGGNPYAIWKTVPGAQQVVQAYKPIIVSYSMDSLSY